MNEKVNRFNAGKAQIESIETKFERLLNLSGTMDEKIRDLQKVDIKEQVQEFGMDIKQNI